MGYLYKLVDEKEIKLAKEGKISLSHPIFEFKGSEGKFINFAKRIYDKYKVKGLNIKPSPADLQEIKEWIDLYKSTFGDGFKDEDIVSESMIIFCGIMQGFCGYFTTINLFEKNNLRSFLEKNKLKNKTSILRLDDSIFKYHHWRTSDLKEAFSPFKGDSNDLQEYNGFTHPIDIIYNAHYDDYKELLKIYNKDEIRYAHNWFNNLSKEYEWQQEKRIIFLVRSLEKNSFRTGCNRVYNYGKVIESYQELVYCKLVDAIDYCQKGPRFVYLNVGKDKLSLYDLQKD